MKQRQYIGISTVFVLMPFLTGCWMAAAAGAGAYGGYKMKEKGYTVQSPVTKKEKKKSEQEAQ